MSAPPIIIAMLAILFIFIFENRQQVLIVKLLTEFFFCLVDIEY